MKKPLSHTILVCLVLLAALSAACTKAPYTNRSQLMLIDESTETKLGDQAAQQVLKEVKLSHDQAIIDRVTRVGGRIAKAADEPQYDWEFYVVDDDKTANAFALPGGKVFVYTGILPFAKNDAQLATVMGHEVAHALARHGAERMSIQLAAQTGGAVAGAAIGLGDPGMARIFNQAYGVGANLGLILPYSRTHETEADEIGMILMAKAGYDPAQAIAFWQNMEAGSSGEQPPAFLSTHPSHEQRIKRLEEFLPQAEQYYRKSR